MSTEGRHDDVANVAGNSTKEIRLAIREGIQSLKDRKQQGGLQTPPDASRSNLVSEAALSVDLERGHFDRFRALTRSLRELDAELADFVNRLGESPPTPPTLRGRIGRLIIEYFNRLLWWKAVENRRFAELTLQINRTHSELLCALEEGVFSIGKFLPLAAILDRRVQETEHALLDLQSRRTEVGAEHHGMHATRTAEAVLGPTQEHARSQKTAQSQNGIKLDLH